MGIDIDMELSQIKNKADISLVAFWSVLTVKQDAYFAKHGKYFQLLLTNKSTDGADVAFETRHPSDEKHLADVGFNYTGMIPFSISVDEWASGDNAGYSATVIV